MGSKGELCCNFHARDAFVFVRRRHRGDGPLLLFVHDDRVVARTRRANVRTQTSFASGNRFPTWQASWKERSPPRVDASTATEVGSIKESLNLGHVRCKSPEMVRRELWTTLLGYNLIRMTAAGAALLHDKQPRQISFTSTCQYLLASWMFTSCGLMDKAKVGSYCLKLLEQIAECEVANRPGRLEPRVVKRRPKPYKLMQKPRNELRRELRKVCT